MFDALFDTVTPFVQKYTWISGALTSTKINAFSACKPTINGFQNPDACAPYPIDIIAGMELYIPHLNLAFFG
jgi:hypothetical protein